MPTLRHAALQSALILLACLRGAHEFILLQGWRLHDRLRKP
jgi:hypothetical protein